VSASDQIRVLDFPPFRLDLVAGQLLRGDEPIAIRPKTFATLCHLAAQPGDGVTKDELLAAVWPDVRKMRATRIRTLVIGLSPSRDLIRHASRTQVACHARTRSIRPRAARRSIP
jgi:DNA-binding response OmpR family regulator